MKIRWRKHGLVLMTLLVVSIIVSYLLEAYTFLTDKGLGYNTEPFIKNQIPFNYYYNVLLPKIGIVVIMYLLYVFINLFTIPTFLTYRRKTLLAYIWLGLQLLLISYLFALSVNVASWFTLPYAYNYGGFRMLALLGYNDTPLQNLLFGFERALIIVALYGIYTIIREYVIYLIEKSGSKRLYRTLIANQITLCMTIFLWIPAFMMIFDVRDHDIFYMLYFIFVPATILLYFTNTYWIFPAWAGKKLLNWPLIIRLILSILLVTFIFRLIAFRGEFGSIWLLNIGFQMFIFTPLTWLLYEQNKDKISQLRGAEKALVKSKADLQFLRSQINPHFLFNTLNSLYGMALMEKSPQTAASIQKLGDLMRFMLYDNLQDFIPMEKEISYLKNYIALQKLRIQASPDIIIEHDISEHDCGHLIVPMLLIPLVENAFKYGISLTEQSWIKIKLSCDAQKIDFEVRNSIHADLEDKLEKEQSGIGLENVQERLRLFYENRYQFTFGIQKKEYVAKLVIQIKD